ncbi:MAG: GH3 auxin-responsive promoter family protein [Chitinophagaceae bacterium]|nr:GH3 auxin-responsive promoter family protein [Chitinophagaceae bacterium]MBP6478146.1 GH3 auxin-responsive promoter family protein [Chitinophagaceae bacterium]MBP7109887.1 GH3 auxin-responsive promoter family protein [Chitinophagaceae bacterium]MBP7313619.1 GH3 auxin-responsive promoter family protein [Chitinophagaceae bacterium]HQZ50051.1 GH3 auxin-responsive promoter family protein [Chitinophagaceae bacterium]
MANIIDIKLPRAIAAALRIPPNDPRRQQIKVLKKLLKKARFTEFGQRYRFDDALLSKHPGKKFQELVPVHDYNKIYEEWWKKTLDGVADVAWPGKIKYYALSSGTSDAASKYIPVTKELLRSNTVNYLRQILSLIRYDEANKKAMTKGFLFLGGATDLKKGKAGWYAGDLSGILAKKRPFWFQTFYKPGGRIAAMSDWNQKLNEIVEHAKDWDIGHIVGVPAWCQMCMEMVIERYKVKNIHEIWPNFSFFVHGGVSFEPYKKSFEKLLGKPIVYIENYLSSEGFIGYKTREHAKGMQLILNNNIFFEFVPFDDKNFDSDGKIVDNPDAKMIHEVEEGKEYALLMSTNAGAWRYILGDTIKFVDLAKIELVITGRTKHFLSLTGEHLSVENMNKAIGLVSDEFNVSIPEFTVAGIPHGTFFAHRWYIATDDKVDKEKIRKRIDENLRLLNDDYATERDSALKEVFVEVLSEDQFMKFMELKGKIGSQHKFPRVMKGKMLEEWEKYLKEGCL